jgi:predicted TIM-barrel fold metal-dependent hydrolase
MTIIDAHVHLWHHDAARYPRRPWLEADLPPHDGTADRLVRLMDEAGVAAALNVQVPWYGDDNTYHREAAQRFPGRFALLGVIDPALGDAPERIERMLGRDQAQGLRIHLNEPGRTEQLRTGQCDPVIAAAGALGVPIQFLARMRDMAAIRRSAEAFPRTSFVVDHLGHPDLSEPPPFPAAAPFFELGQLPNVHAKVSLLCDHARTAYPYPDVQEFVRRTIERFGASRLMWGSNYPLIPEVRTTEPVDYRRALELVRSDWPWLAGEDKAWILGGTARKLWRFPAEAGTR